MKEILDSGSRRQFESGAVRDIQEGKGRCDLLPLDVVGRVIEDDTMSYIEEFKSCGDVSLLYTVIQKWIGNLHFISCEEAVIEVSKQFEGGAKKYGENNWRKGIPVRCFVDSAVRHYLKYMAGYTDEPHDRAALWNLLCAAWTCVHTPELNEYGRDDKVGITP